MKFLFEEQPHQLRAVRAVADLFDGALMPPEDAVGSAAAPGAAGHAGFRLEPAVMTKNLRTVQQREGVAVDDDLELLTTPTLLDPDPRSFPNFSVEMETGTGKTYVYIRTCLQLAEELGLRKFVVVVHSQAIRMGVLKTFEQTASHFGTTFAGLSYDWGALSDNSGLDDFLDPSDSVRFLVAMVQAFDRPDTNTLYRAPEHFSLWSDDAGSRAAALASVQPVLVVDEPQNMATPRRRQALATLNPLFALRYSATHREPFNLVHRLDARGAQELGLVKSITVKGVAAGRDAGQAYVALLGTTATKKTTKAQLRVNVPDEDSPGSVKQRTITVSLDDDLEEETGLPAYEGWIVQDIERKPDRVIFSNGEVAEPFEETDTDRSDLWRDQIKATIRAHLAREVEFERDGVPVKVMSLFFIDAVDDYEGEDAVLPEMFDTAYREVCETYFKGQKLGAPEERRTAYFARTKKGVAKNTRGLTDDAAAEARAYELIIAAKEKILVRSEPRAFIFSHSALREGWDNPNVFQTCFLRHSGSPLERRQQVGRGLRLAVQEDGVRLTEREPNKLTVVVDEAFSEFRDALNEEYASDDRGGGGAGGPSGGSPTVEDADKAVEVVLRPDLYGSDDFKDLWSRIRYKARYRVVINPDDLVKAVTDSDEVKALKHIKTTANLITTGQLVYGAGGTVDVSDEEAGQSLGTKIVRRGRLPDLIRLIEDRLAGASPPLYLTRATISKIVAAAPYHDRSVRQPEQWCAVLAEAIRVVTVDQMVRGIVYEPLPESSWWSADVVFRSPETAYDNEKPADPTAIWRGVVPSAPDGPNLYSHVIHDSRVERRFGLSLDNQDEVKLFCKLPRRFSIETPVGRYSPDWAMVVEQDGVERLFLVRETKGTLDLKDLDWGEAMRIRFAGSHFAAAPNGAVHFDHTTDSHGLRLPEPDEDTPEATETT